VPRGASPLTELTGKKVPPLQPPEIVDFLNRHYPMRTDRVELFRDAGSTSYTAFSGTQRYFLRIMKPAFHDTAARAADIQVFLHKRDFPVPPVVFAAAGLPYVRTDGGLFILYEYIEGDEPDPERDAEAIGALVGRLHQVMREYSGELIHRDRQFYIGRYIDLLRAKPYRKADAFAEYGDALWEKVKDLPRGYCHGDMYSGNFHKTPDGKLYVLDFDTSCDGFPMYDPTLICNRTDYFDFDKNGYEKSKQVFSRFLPGYLKYSALSRAEIDVFYDLITLYHFALQATIIEVFGLDCVDGGFLDKQLDWLYRWRDQCESGGGIC